MNGDHRVYKGQAQAQLEGLMELEVESQRRKCIVTYQEGPKPKSFAVEKKKEGSKTSKSSDSPESPDPTPEEQEEDGPKEFIAEDSQDTLGTQESEAGK